MDRSSVEYAARSGRTGDATHWTSFGVFRLTLEYRGGSPVAVLTLNGQLLGVDGNFGDSAMYLGQGSHDARLGFSAREAGVPAFLSEWNMLS